MPRRILQGVVVSTACEKTASVRVERQIMHPLYKKYVTRSSKYAAHDPENRCKVGDKVRIRECAPISKTKCWEVMNDQQTAE